MRWTDSDLRRLLKRAEQLPNGCWKWTGSIDAYGYGRFWIKGKYLTASRFSFIAHNGVIPKHGETVDHICENRICINPAHLRILTIAENVRRGIKGKLKTHCRKGHELIGDNLLIQSGDVRRCKQCRHHSSNESYARNK